MTYRQQLLSEWQIEELNDDRMKLEQNFNQPTR